MKKYGILILVVFISLLSIKDVYAHPGRTDSRGCHYCRTNCAKWGLSNGEYHCHNNGSSSNSTSNSVNNIYGCTDSNSINYNSRANVDDGSCIKKVYGCTNKDAYNYDQNANVDNGKCVDKIFGCTNEKAYNYNSKANTSDGSCLFKIEKTFNKKIKYKTKYKYSYFRKKGSIIQNGKNGKKKITKEIIIDENNNITNEKVIKEKIITKPRNKIVITKNKK